MGNVLSSPSPCQSLLVEETKALLLLLLWLSCYTILVTSDTATAALACKVESSCSVSSQRSTSKDLSGMGNSRSTLNLQQEEIIIIEDETGFTKPQIERLYSRFSILDKQGRGYLTREDFLRIPELAINPLGDRIVHAFFAESKTSDNDKVYFTVSCQPRLQGKLQCLQSKCKSFSSLNWLM